MPDLPIFRRRWAYGADLDRDWLVLVKVEAAGRSFRSTTLFQGTAAPGEPRLAALAAELRREVARGRAAFAAVLPAQDGFARWLETPLSSEVKARKVLPSLLDVQLPFPLETCLYQFPAVRADAAGRVRALAVAARRSEIAAQLDRFRALGLDPVALDHEGLALWTQSLTEVPLAPPALRIVAYLGAARTALAVGDRELLGVHGIRLGTDELGVAEAPALRQWAGRINQILRSARPEPAPDGVIQWLWTGPGAARAEHLTALQAAISAPGKITFATVGEPATFLARAAAGRLARPGALPCNLRCGDLTHAAIRQQRASGRRRIALAALLAGLLLGGLSVGWRGWFQYRLTVVQSELTALARQLARVTRVDEGQEVLTVQRALKKQTVEIQPFLAAFRPALSRDLAAVLAAARQNRLTLDTLTHDGKAFILHGATGDWNRCDPLAASLRGLGYAVELSREEAGADEVIRFTLKGSRAP